MYFRKAIQEDIGAIWQILQAAIARRKQDGSSQWQDGYPNPEVVADDIHKEIGYVLEEKRMIVGYVAILVNDEPEYSRLKGEWLTNEDFVVFHRLAISELKLGMGLAKRILDFIEEHAKKQGVRSIKADTNFDNLPMLHLFHRLGYLYCGEVTFRGSSRKAFEKVLND